MAESVKCPACGASNAPGAQWCGQCFAGFEGASTPAMPADQTPARPSPPPSAPPTRRDGTAGARPPVDPPPPPNATSRSEPAAPTPVPKTPAGPVEQGWTCAACGSANPVSLDVCSSCNTSIFETFGAAEEDRPDVEVSTAALWSLLPGGGHFRTGQGALGLAVAGLVISTLAFGILLLGGNRRPVGIVLLLVSVIAWAISMYDATRFAAGDDEATLLRPKVVTAVMGLVFATVIVAAVSLTSGETP